jgi:hypothetical protein
MMTDKKCIIDRLVKLKAKEIYDHVTEGQEDVKPLLATAGGFAHFIGDTA